ncbi:MAG TPA: phosphate acyltransferase [Candidatus Omnitrophota bacterium]|nr:phosphate acyltransferase [Candidatus Omnitrophota bacterium]HRZ14164.1 phosphate acyltransferase [Candidatus Omnitrophota bacterium]
MEAIRKIRERARNAKKKIVLPEYKDKRVLEAFKMIKAEGVADVTLLTPEMVAPQDKERYVEFFYNLRKSKGVTLDQAREMFEDPLFPAAMMVREGKFDGFVAGASHTTADVCRAGIHCIGIDERLMIACSSFVMAFDNNRYAPEGALIYADCGLLPDPNPRQLACIGVAAAELARKVLDLEPRIAFLSYSTKGSAEGRSIDRVREGVKIFKEMEPNLLVDGELQLDAAIVPDVAKIKTPGSAVAGNASVLIFPNLDAGNIGYKLTERLAGARALGPLLMGLKNPCSDLSRGCSAEDVVDCVAVTAIRAR